MRPTPRNLLLVATCLHLAVSTDALPAHATASCTLEAGPKRAVIGLVDAETLALDDGSEVRLVGTLAPVAPKFDTSAGAWPPERDAREELQKLVLGRSVDLAFEMQRYDRYGRLLAHVFVDLSGQRIWLQGKLLSSGHARAYALPGLGACFSELLQHEAVARNAGVGLWSHAAYAERSAHRTRELMRYRNTFQIVTGKVSRVAAAGRNIYLNFGKDWREDLTAGISAANLDTEAKQRLEGLSGKRVRVRGWIERRSGPFIQLSDPSQIEPAEDASLASDRRFPPRRRAGTDVRTGTDEPRP